MPAWARLERFPLAVALPWLLAAGPWLPYLPLPFRVRLQVLAPIHVAPHGLLRAFARHGAEAEVQLVREILSPEFRRARPNRVAAIEAPQSP
jgi:hypothetical protein